MRDMEVRATQARPEACGHRCIAAGASSVSAVLVLTMYRFMLYSVFSELVVCSQLIS